MTKQPCALLINDIHVSKDNIDEFKKNWDEALAVCEKHTIDYIVIGGDLWLSRSAQTLSTLMAVRDALLKATKVYNLDVIIANGNHCKVNQEDVEGYSHVFSGYDYAQVVDDYVELRLSEKASLWIMSYYPENGSFIEKINNLKTEIDKSKFNVLYAHEGIRGGLSVPSDDELPTEVFEGFDSVLVGHYHDRKKIPNTNIEYIGASRQHNFGEDEEKGYTILYEDGTTRFVKNNVNLRYTTIEVDEEDVNDDFFEAIKKIKEDKRYRVKVRVKSYDNTLFVDKEKLIESGVNKIELFTDQDEVAKVDPQSITRKFDKTGIKEEYINFCKQKSINSKLGLKYLNKIN